ncbi:MAG: response regulator [SAR324 cluster bacterium]|nr:response regulator [SAR324 cluster bacterium]MCZ6533298.1 response regulator [SAR324 cluster bacterium]MCZ6559148.1 response regulator [SAR324 cluster bacterium]MCZ6628704.1 response regulator [SAR324 cluster bacterium]MCZ6645349.1 response regulator [SAR324 cluster bacterium]
MTKSVLVIDDVPDILELLDVLLRREGIQVHKAESASVAMDILKREAPHGVVLDIMLPNSDGMKILENIRASSEHAELPVVCMSAVNLSGEARAYIQRSSLGLLDKSSFPDIVARIKKALDTP